MAELHSSPEHAGMPSRREHNAALDEVQRLQAQLDDLQQQLAWSNRLASVGTLSAVLAHEYNNLLTPIASYAQLALKQPDDLALVEKALTAAVEGVQHATRVAEATLAFARPDDHEAVIDERATLTQAIEAALACLGRPLDQDDIDLQVQVPDDRLAISLLGMQQVLINLITNARRALLTCPRARRLELLARSDDGGLLLEVSDNGPGLPESVMGRVFEPFVTAAHINSQGRRSTDRVEPGTGLGLSICRDLITSAGGWINVNSSDQGASFHVWLPLAQADSNR